uniref:Disks large-associated protein 5 n=1 Tax=Strongyloides stercoralis TaxID=6248 RepID=A0A0K0DVB6_STRER
MNNTNEPKNGLKKSINFFRFRTPKKDAEDTPLRLKKGSRLHGSESGEDSFTLDKSYIDSPIVRFFKKVKPKQSGKTKNIVDNSSTLIETDNQTEKSKLQDDQFDFYNVEESNQKLPTYVSVSVALNGYHLPSQKNELAEEGSIESAKNLQSSSQDYVTTIKIESIAEPPEVAEKFSTEWGTVSDETPEAYKELADTSISLIDARKRLAKLLLSEHKEIMCDDSHTTLLQVNGHGDMITKNIGKLYKYIDNCLKGVQGYGETTTVNDLSSFWFGVIQPELDKYSKILDKADKYRENNYKEILQIDDTTKVVKKVQPKVPANKKCVVESEKIKQQKAAREEKRKKFLQEMKKKAISSRNNETLSGDIIY